MLENLVPVMDVLHFWVDRALRTDFTAEAASDAEGLVNSYLHADLLNLSHPTRDWAQEPRA